MKQSEPAEESEPTQIVHGAPSTDIKEEHSTGGQKRPAINTSSDDKRPQPPPPKRFKKEKGSIFIPKKPNKVGMVVQLYSPCF